MVLPAGCTGPNCPPPHAPSPFHAHRMQQVREQRLRPRAGFLEARHSEAECGAGAHLTPQMRMIVVSWVVEVAAEFQLHDETLHLAVALLDRLLAATQVRAPRHTHVRQR